jgi:hypothetical protein
MADFWSVPLATNELPGSVNNQIAQGPNFSWIGNLPDSYVAGRNAGFQARNQDVFKDGLPRDPNGNVDWQQASEMLAKAGGSGAIDSVVNLQNYQLARDAINAAGDQQGSGAGPAMSPPRTALAPPSSGSAISGAVPPGGVSMPTARTPDPSSTANGPQPQQAGLVTARSIAQRTGADPLKIAASIGVGPDDQLDGADPQTRQAIIDAIRQQQPQQPAPQQEAGMQQSDQQPAASGGGLPGAPASPNGPTSSAAAPAAAQYGSAPNGPAPGATAQIDGSMSSLEQRYEAQAQSYFKKGAALSVINPAMGARYQAMGDAAAKQAQAIRDSMLKNAELTPEQKNSTDPNVLGFEQRKAQGTQVATDDAKAFGTDAEGIAQLGRNSYNGIQKAQLAKNLTLDPNFYSGPLHEGVQTYNQFKSIFGSNPTSALPQEAFNKAVNDMLQEQIRAMGKSGVGRVLQSEVGIMKQSIASLGMTPASNRALLDIVGRVYKQQQDMASIAETIRNRRDLAPGQMSATLNQAIDNYQRTHPLFAPDELQHPQLLAAPDAPPASAQWSPQQKRAWASGIGLKPGDPVRIGGQIVAVP